MKDSWEQMNGQVLAYAEHLHDQMRMMYGISPFDVLSPEKLKEVKKMEIKPSMEWNVPYRPPVVVSQGTAATFSAGGSGGSAIARKQDFPLPEKDKTLLSKPHPKDCICPKCKRDDGTHVLPSSVRIGDAARDEVLEHLRQMRGEGYLSLPEFEARMEAVLAATMKSDLDLLVRDLPPAARKKEAAVVMSAGGKAVLDPPVSPQRNVVTFIMTIASFVLPVLAGIGLMEGAERTGLLVIMALAALASLLLTILRD